MIKIKIEKDEEKQRLDKFLTQKFENWTRSQIQKKIKNGEITVNQKQVVVHYFLKAGDEINVNQKKEENFKKKNFKLKIIADEQNFLVIEKQAGLLVHPIAMAGEKTLVDLLIKKYPEIKKVFDDQDKNSALRPGVVHRIDKKVSGMLLVAKNQKTFNYLKKIFKQRKITKKYTALVYFKVERDDGQIDTPLQMSHGKAVVKSDLNRDDKQIKEAKTEYSVVKRFKNYTLLEINLKTGRTHQIRAHLNSIGHPIVGDNLYTTKKHRKTIDRWRNQDNLTLQRIFLHASFLSFKDQNGQQLTFKSELPDKLKKFLQKLD